MRDPVNLLIFQRFPPFATPGAVWHDYCSHYDNAKRQAHRVSGTIHSQA